MAGLTMTACANTDSSTESTQSSGGGQTAGLTIGTTDKVTKLDPAGSYDNGSFNVMRQVYGFLVEPEPDSTDAAFLTGSLSKRIRNKRIKAIISFKRQISFRR